MTILEELKQIEREATKGPWDWKIISSISGSTSKNNWLDVIYLEGPPECAEIIDFEDYCGVIEKANAKFISASRTMVPRLIRALEMCLNSSYDAALRSNIEHILSGIDDVCLGTDKDGEA